MEQYTQTEEYSNDFLLPSIDTLYVEAMIRIESILKSNIGELSIVIKDKNIKKTYESVDNILKDHNLPQIIDNIAFYSRNKKTSDSLNIHIWLNYTSISCHSDTSTKNLLDTTVDRIKEELLKHKTGFRKKLRVSYIKFILATTIWILNIPVIYLIKWLGSIKTNHYDFIYLTLLIILELCLYFLISQKNEIHIYTKDFKIDINKETLRWTRATTIWTAAAVIVALIIGILTLYGT